MALAAFALVPSNVLLLDEASNHLDAATIKVLTGVREPFLYKSEVCVPKCVTSVLGVGVRCALTDV